MNTSKCVRIHVGNKLHPSMAMKYMMDMLIVYYLPIRFVQFSERQTQSLFAKYSQ